MRNSKFRSYALFLCRLTAFACLIAGAETAARAQTTTGTTQTVTIVLPTTGPGGRLPTLIDRDGRLIGQIDTKTNMTIDRSVSTGALARLSVLSRQGSPANVTMSTLAPAFTATPGSVVVTVPESFPVGFCASGAFYDRMTGLCTDSKAPYMIVPLMSIAEPAAQMPNKACTAPRIPTFNSATKLWDCLVPAGFKLSM